jgi:DNA-binding Lrp family transcriptional regulator
MVEKYYRGYILARLSKIGSEWDMSEKMIKLKDPDKSWLITYVTPIYGSWDLIIEVSFTKLEDLDYVVTTFRSDESIRENIEETTTIVSSKPNYPPDDL